MSTFLWSLGVVTATIAGVLLVVLNGPDQPATIRPPTARARAPRKRRAPRARAAAVPGRPAAVAVPPPAAAQAPPGGIPGPPAPAAPDSDAMRLRVLPAKPTTVWVRIRSGIVLVVLVAVLGAILALAIGGVLVGIVLAVRSATG